MHSEENIQQRFASAGWELDGGFEGYLVVGYNGDGLSILAYKEAWAWETYEPVFELQDHKSNLTYGVQDIPTPKQAAQLLGENGLSEEEGGVAYSPRATCGLPRRLYSPRRAGTST